MDPALLDLVWEVYQKSGARKPIHVISGYRSPRTNKMLRRRGRGVAKTSQHTRGKALDFFLPEGESTAQLWIDGWLIPQDAANKEDAHLFLNYMMRPDVAANDSNFTWYATANLTAKPMVDEEVTSSPAAFPTSEQVAKMYTSAVLPPKVER